MGSGGSSQAKRAVSATAEADQTEGWSGIMPTAQEHTGPEVHSKLYDEIMSSIDLVFAHFSDGVRGLPAERLGQAMRILGMNPTEDQVCKHLADLGRPKYIDQATFHRFIQDELTKYLEQVQAVVDYLKQYDTDNKGTLSTEEVQAAIRGSELSQKKLQASVAKMPSNSKGQLDIVELATCFLELGDSEDMLEPSEAEKERASASEADSKAVKIQVVKDAVSADAEAGTTDEQCRETRAAEESASGPAAYSTMFNDVIASTNAVFRYFSQPSGVPAERLGHAMAILGMNPTEDEVKKHLADLGGPKYIDQKMFHRFIEEELGKLIPKVQELLDYLKQFDTDGKGALSEEELQEVMRGSELSQDKVQASLRKLPRNSEGHLDIVKLSKYFLELGDSQVEADDSIPGTAKTRQDVASQVREALADALLQRKTSVRDTTADSDLDDGAKESDDQVPGRRPFEAPVRLQGLAEALKTNVSVTSINLQNNSIRNEGVKALAEALKTNTSVTSINLWRNSIGVEGVKALAEALKMNTSVTSIDLSVNSIGAEGVKALAEALKTNTSVTSIGLSWNSIGDEGAQALAEALKTNTSVTSIDVGCNSIGDEGVKALKQVIEEKKKMGFELCINF